VKYPRIRAVLSTLLIIALLFLATTGSMLYFGKTGMIWGMPRQAIRETHFWAATAMCLLGILHLILNFRLYAAQLRKLAKHDDSADEGK